MALIFILLTQLVNQTPFNLDFEVHHGRRLLPKLGPGKTRFAKTSRVLRQLRHDGPDWIIRVLIDGEFTGIELRPRVILDYVRVVFRVETDGDGDVRVLYVDGAPENRYDVLLRHRNFGCMRNFYWNSRRLDSIDRSDSKLATKLRNMEGHCRYLAPFVDINLEKRYPSREKESPKKEHNPPIVSKITKPTSVQQERPRADVPQPLDPSVDSEKLVRSRDPRPLTSPMETEENDIKRSRPNGTLTSPARVRDDLPRPLNRPMDSQKQVRPTDEPRPLEPQTGETGVKSLRPNGTATAQQMRPSPRDEESNVVDKDSFVHGLLIVFSFVFCILLKFIF